MIQHGFKVVVGDRDLTRLIDGDLSFSNADPGGYELCSFSFAQDVRIRKGQLIFIYAGTEEVWQGRVSDIGRTFTPSVQTTVTGEGPGAVLKDNQDFQEVFLDRDLSKWVPISSARRLSELQKATPKYYQDGTLKPNPHTGDAAVEIGFSGSWGATGQQASAMQYQSQVPLYQLYYEWIKLPDTNAVTFAWGVSLMIDAEWSDADATNDIGTGAAGATTTGSGTLTWKEGTYSGLPERQRFCAEVEFSYQSGVAAGTAGVFYGVLWNSLIVYGLHGLPLQRDVAGYGGYTPAAIAEYVAKRAGLRVGVIDGSTDFVLTQAVYQDPVSHEDVIFDVNRYVSWHWGTWGSDSITDDGPRFWFCPRPERYTCSISRQASENLEFSERLEGLYDRCVVNYTTPDGHRKQATAERNTDDLTDADLSRTITVNGNFVTEAAAEVYGMFILQLSEKNARAAGSGELPELLDRGRPSWTLKAGRDKLLIRDMPEPQFKDGMRDEFHVKRVEVKVGADGPKTEVQIGIGADLIEVLNARLELGEFMAANT